MRYEPFLDVSVAHGYYSDGITPDFDLEPTSPTERLLRNHRLAVRSRPGGIGLATPVGGDGRMFIPFADDTTFVWHLRLVTADITLVTDRASLDVGKIMRYTNDGASRRLIADEHPDSGPMPTDVVATVEVTVGPFNTPDVPTLREHVVELRPSSTWWAYYLVTDLPPESGAFSIVDTASAPLTFDASGVRDLVADPDPADPLAERLADVHPSLRRIRFRSELPIAAQRPPRRNIELRLADVRVAGPLTNPSPSSGSTLSVEVDERIEQQPSLTHILRYPNHQSANQGV